jgi:hypothetical protein
MSFFEKISAISDIGSDEKFMCKFIEISITKKERKIRLKKVNDC